ncbi:MAG: S8 family serine peptidase [bacterium]|nr:S8 family serine peptidase [bacterium]
MSVQLVPVAVFAQEIAETTEQNAQVEPIEAVQQNEVDDFDGTENESSAVIASDDGDTTADGHAFVVNDEQENAALREDAAIIVSPKEPSTTTSRTNAQQRDAAAQPEPYVPGEVLVRFKTKSVDLTTATGKAFAEQFADAQHLDRKALIAASNIAVYKTRDGETTTDAVTRLRWIPEVLHAQPNFVYQPRSNDTLYGALWALENTGQIVNGVASTTPDHDIDAPEAWVKSEGDSVIVAVIDSGVAFNHPDLLASMWDGAICVDENGNALGGCEHGYDFTGDGDKQPLPTTSSHGTHVAGTIAAVKDNGTGVAGVAPRAKIMALRSDLSTTSIISAINFAGANGAAVINASFGGAYSQGTPLSADDLLFKQSVEQFPGAFVAAAGNGNAFGDLSVGDVHGVDIDSYPCDFDSANVICVAATNQGDELASFSDYGAESVDVGAPGTSIVSTGFTQEAFFDAALPSFSGTKFTRTSGSWATSTWDGNDKMTVANDSYVNDDDGVLTLTNPIDTRAIDDGQDVQLEFYVQMDTEEPDGDSCFDYLAVEVNDDDGAWTRAYVNCGNVLGTQTVNLGAGTQHARIRFVWHTDSSGTGSQVPIIDDVVISNTHDYEYKNGTSMAAPHVAGVAALVRGFNKNVTTSQIKKIVMETGDALAALNGKTVSGRRVNANNALAIFDPHVALEEDDVLVAGGRSTEGAIKFNFVVRDGIAELPFTLAQFEYSTDDGETWQAPENGDASGALESFVLDDRTTVDAIPEPEGSFYAIFFNPKHADLTGLADVDQDDVVIRFKANDGAVNSPFATSEPFSVDLQAPTATLTDTPDALTTATSATIAVGGDDDMVSYQYALDDDAFSPVTPIADPVAISGLVDGEHTLRVIGIDDDGNEQAETDATTFTWTVDTTPGTALLTSKPDARTNETSATFTVGGEDVATYTYQLDGGVAQGPFSVDATIELADLAEGSHTIAVTGLDALDNVQPTPTTYTWIIDATPPSSVSGGGGGGGTNSATLSLSGAPVAVTNTTGATLIVGGDDVVAYRFALDGGVFGEEALVAAPIELTNLTDGTHTVAVIGRDDVGNWQAEANATTVSWTVDTTAPTLAEVESVATPTNDATPSLTVQVEADATWEVLRGETVLANGTGTGEAQTAQLATLTDGIYTLTLTATDAAGNAGSIALSEFVVDTASPTGLSLNGVPDALTNATSVTITVVAGNDLVAYRSAFDGSDFGAETPVATPITLNDLEDGAHTLRVIGKDAAGNWMPEGIAVAATWTVDTVPPIAALSDLPFAETPATTATITVGGEDVVAYRAALDGGAFGDETPVADLLTLTDLSDATHTLAVIGRDAAGNWQAEDAATTFAWLVDRSLAVPPTADPASGALTAPQIVHFTAPLAESIHYTYEDAELLSCTTGSSFGTDGELHIDRGTTLFMVACYAGGVPSEVQTFTYTFASRGGGGGGGGGSAGTIFATPAVTAPQSVTPSTPAPSTAPSGRVLGTRSFADGVLLRVNERDIYLVDSGQLHKVPNPQALWRYRHHERLEVGDADIAGYTVGDSVLAMHQRTLRVLGVRTFINGVLLRVNGGTIYLVDGDALRKIPTIEALWPYRDRERFEVGTDVLETYTLGAPTA